MLCIIAMIVFGVLGIFSVGYRKMAKEAFDCTFRLITLRPCQSSFDQKLKSKILTKMMRFPKLASYTNKHFKAISLVVTILFLVSFFASLGYTAYGVYNLVTVGTCDPQHPENCVFTPMLNKTSGNAPVCVINAEFVEFYGAECPHCKAMEPIVAQVEKDTGITFQKIEVWHNDTNKATFMMHAQSIERDCGLLGVPAFYSNKTDKAICGEISAEKLKEFIRNNG